MINTDEYYNLEDKTDYAFYSYVVVVETEHNRYYKLTQDINEITLYRNMNEEKYKWISPIWKTNKQTYMLLDDDHLRAN
jgi:hypothetical protein